MKCKDIGFGTYDCGGEADSGMTLEKLREEADKLGYKVVPKPKYDCYCCGEYPNEGYKRKSGKWKCVDKYEFACEAEVFGVHRTYCRSRR